MIREDEDALICDLAETYHIYDYKRLPVKMAAALAVGLHEDSRIKMKLSGNKVSLEMMMMAAIVDRLSLLVWTKTKDAEKGRNKPKSILESLYPTDSEFIAFESGEDFEQERDRLINQSERR